APPPSDARPRAWLMFAQELSRLDVPVPDAALGVSGQEGAPVGREGDYPLAPLILEPKEFAAGLGVPDTHVPGPHRGDPLAVRREGNRAHPAALAPAQGAQPGDCSRGQGVTVAVPGPVGATGRGGGAANAGSMRASVRVRPAGE